MTTAGATSSTTATTGERRTASGAAAEGVDRIRRAAAARLAGRLIPQILRGRTPDFRRVDSARVIATISPVMAEPKLGPDDTQQIEGLALTDKAAAKPAAKPEPAPAAATAAAPAATPAAAAPSATPTAGAPERDVFKTVFTVAWMAILLGFAVEALLSWRRPAFALRRAPSPSSPT